MLPFKLVCSDGYYLPIGEHVFPAQKYRRVCERLLATGLAQPDDFVAPEPATDRDELLVHTGTWVSNLRTGTFSAPSPPPSASTWAAASTTPSPTTARAFA